MAEIYEEESQNTSAGFIKRLDTCFRPRYQYLKWQYSIWMYAELDEFFAPKIYLPDILKWLVISPKNGRLLIVMGHRLDQYLNKALEQSHPESISQPLLHFAVYRIQQYRLNEFPYLGGDAWRIFPPVHGMHSDMAPVFFKEQDIIKTLLKYGWSVTDEWHGITAWELPFLVHTLARPISSS